MTEKQVLMKMLHNDYDVQYGRLSLARVDKTLKFSDKRYQVHNNENLGQSEVFEDLETAVDKFLQLKAKVK